MTTYSKRTLPNGNVVVSRENTVWAIFTTDGCIIKYNGYFSNSVGSWTNLEKDIEAYVLEAMLKGIIWDKNHFITYAIEERSLVGKIVELEYGYNVFKFTDGVRDPIFIGKAVTYHNAKVLLCENI